MLALLLLDTYTYGISQSSSRTLTGQNNLWTEYPGMKDTWLWKFSTIGTAVATPTPAND